MSGRRAPHLQRRNGIYHLRVRVPDHVRPLLGWTEVKRSLKTLDFSEARPRAARLAAEVMKAFGMVSSFGVSREQAQRMVQAIFADMMAADAASGGYDCETGFPDLELAEQRGLSSDRISDLRRQLLSGVFDGGGTSEANDVTAKSDVNFDALPDHQKRDILSGVARFQIEEQRLFALRLDDRLASFSPSDDLFTQAHPAEGASEFVEQCNGLSVGQAIERYLHDGKRQWVHKTYAARTWQLRFFGEHVGTNVGLAAITERAVRSFRDGVKKLHKRHGKMKGALFSQRQTSNTAHQVSDKTASITYEPIRAFFRWAHEIEGLIDTNPAARVRIATAKRPKGEKSRRNFTADELKILFTAPIFTGCRSTHRRYEPGPLIIKDAKFWIPVLGFYTGARLGELIQLHVKDVHLDGEVPYLSVNEDNGVGVAVGDRKHVKSEAGIRLVPLHPDVMALGFEQFVAGRTKRRGEGRVRLFDEFAYGSDQQASTVASKWFGRFMNSRGLTDPKIVFHSFRHNAEDALRDAKAPKYVIDRIIGHCDLSASGSYGEGASPEVLHDAVKAMKVRVCVPDLVSSAVGKA